MKTKTLLSLALIPAILALAACGSSSDDNSSSTAAATTSSAASSSAFSTKNVPGVGEILVDAQGNALYTNDQDTTADVKCTGECVSIWIPLMQNGKPVGFEGKPLYTFAQDSAGKVTGDGVRDTFGGVDFVWTVASPGGSVNAAPPPATTSTQSDTTGGSGYSGGY